MHIAIIGAGKIGSTLARKLSDAGHVVRLANSRDPETIKDLAESCGARAMRAGDAVEGADVVITSIPFQVMPSLAAIFEKVAEEVVVIDTSNYFPFRDDDIETLSDYDTESDWVAAQLGHPVIKAWNSILAGSLATEGRTAGAADRIALPVAGDSDGPKQIALQLVDETGFDAVDAGPLSESWRQQPGTPAYCTDLDADGLRRSLARADRAVAPQRRDELASTVMKSRESFTNADILALGRATYR